MALSLKTRGREEIRSLKSRTSRQLSLGRIDQEDHDKLQELLARVENYIHNMEERDGG